ncbi:MAG: alpha-1,4-glucan--maltose-1-phosphate maltosyltransferase [Ilumatobacteraceae bacterium]
MKLPSARPSRVVIEPVAPVVDGGRFAAKVTIGEPVPVVVDVFAEGHDAVDAAVRWRQVSPERGTWHETPLVPLGNDRWTATFVPDALGRWEYQTTGWSARTTTWWTGIHKKIDADVDVSVELLEGAELVANLIARARRTRPRAAAHLERLEHHAAVLDRRAIDELAALRDGDWHPVFATYEDRRPAATADPLPIDVDPVRGRFSSWYEFFPRSTVAPAVGHGTLRDAVGRLDRIAAMGFDIVYLPPIHPIGRVNRKGRNNSTTADPDDVGSPWGIQDHLAVHPDLGTLDDLRLLTRECRARGIELALDIAFQCTPDHVWVTDHPSWFRHRPDGSIQYAENPPKKYQDIYPIDFETDDWRPLWKTLADVIRFWIDQGVTVFRVDNPHTKAFPFWEWCIATIRTEHPEVIFLAEAFTRPRVMERLAKLGFNQSYTYFTWRQSAADLREYYTDLSTRTVDHFRPNSWPNTPDILTEQLQHGGRAMFINRAILASTLSANWGIYGPAFELLEHRSIKPGSEEYLDSEKYQTRQWDLDDRESIEPLITRLNEIRRAEPALQHLRTLRFHDTDSDGLLCFSKTDPSATGDPILVVVNVSSHARHAGNVHVDPTSFGIGLGHDDEYEVVDLLGGGTYRWRGWHNYVDLTPGRGAAHIFAVRHVDDVSAVES